MMCGRYNFEENFDHLNGLEAGFAKVVPGSVALGLASRPDPVRTGEHSLRLSYDFSGELGISLASVIFWGEDGEIGRILPGYPSMLGVWIYGDGNGHWLRAQLKDCKGNAIALNLTQPGGLNWVGWKYVTSPISPELPFPVKLCRVYVVEDDNANKNAGIIYFDQVRAEYGESGEDWESPEFSGMSPKPETTVHAAHMPIGAFVRDAGSGVDPASIRMMLDHRVIEHTYDPLTGLVEYKPNEPIEDGEHSVLIEAADFAGNPAMPSAKWTFRMYTGPDTDAPVITVIGPLDGMTTRTTRPRISARLYDSHTGIDWNKTKLMLDGRELAFRYDETSETIYFTPEPLPPESRHAVSLITADRAGNAAEVSWSFTVGPSLGQPKNPNKFQISVIGDGGYYFEGHGTMPTDILLREQIARINREPETELIAYVGDIVDYDTEENFRLALPVLHSFRVPFVISIGNHEITGTNSRRNFHYAFGETNYIFDYGCVRFIGMDSASMGITASDPSQWAWLEDILNETGMKHILIMMHVPPDEIVADGRNLLTGHGFRNKEDIERLYNMLGWYKRRHPERSIAVLSGDLHAYLHKRVQDVDYIISGGGGKFTHVPAEEGGFFHYLNLKVDGDSLSWDVIPLFDYIAFDSHSVELKPGERLTLTGTAEFLTSTNAPITLQVQAPFKREWYSSDPIITEVDGNGMVTGKSSGEAVITVRCGWREARTTVVVTAAAGCGADGSVKEISSSKYN
ncbi:metallophosphoesterase [Paenibacillus filicis]|uniref:Metallophosphoesterase n=1 Tax=Paenibacillus gyeongsangnamensis TaxID=3388067 RepID=A0ABT4QHC0_9BACL|nr:metallophosphoesterase [Paenibacillus filicis]MCZ8516264.1 metallophosphoesterase [Paenibacillus filicis]